MTDIQAFVRRLLSEPPGPPDSVQLEVDTDGDIVGFYEVLLTILIDILKSWYEPPINISRLTQTDLVKITEYFASFGVRFHLTEETVPRVLRINNKEYETKHRLEDMKFQMTNGNTLYTVRFNLV